MPPAKRQRRNSSNSPNSSSREGTPASLRDVRGRFISTRPSFNNNPNLPAELRSQIEQHDMDSGRDSDSSSNGRPRRHCSKPNCRNYNNSPPSNNFPPSNSSPPSNIQAPTRSTLLVRLRAGRPSLNKMPPEVLRNIVRHLIPHLDSPIDADPRMPGPSPPWKPNPTRDLMLVNRHFRDILTEMTYEESVFVVKVHAQIKNGGIEFLNLPRQPLHFKDDSSDRRFTRFTNEGIFAFNRVKKLHIRIYLNENEPRHTVLTAYFMNLALSRLLQTANSPATGSKLTSVKIEFQPPVREKKPRPSEEGMTLWEIARARRERRQAAEAEKNRPLADRPSPWWDPVAKEPRCSEVHSLSDLELVLRPFALLKHSVHMFEVVLPEPMREHPQSLDFVARLTHCLTTRSSFPEAVATSALAKTAADAMPKIDAAVLLPAQAFAPHLKAAAAESRRDSAFSIPTPSQSPLASLPQLPYGSVATAATATAPRVSNIHSLLNSTSSSGPTPSSSSSSSDPTHIDTLESVMEPKRFHLYDYFTYRKFRSDGKADEERPMTLKIDRLTEEDMWSNGD